MSDSSHPGATRQGGLSVLTSRSVLIAWLVLLAAAVWITRDAWVDIFTIAHRDEDQSHVFLVPIVALWMGWMRRARLRRLHPSGTFFGPPLILLGWALSYWGYHHAFQALWHAGALVILVGVTVTGVGVNTFFRLFPAFAVLIFLIPVPGTIRMAIAGPLQTASAHATQLILETFGVPIERLNNLLVINGHDVAVAEACNGMRMVLALILVSYAFAFSIPLRPYARAVVLLGSPIAAILCNILRLIPTVLLYGYARLSVADAWHDISGWLMLPMAFLVLLGITAMFRWALIPVTRFTLAYQ